MVGKAETDAYDHTGDGGPIQNRASRDVCEADAMPIGDCLERRQELLEQGPAAPGVDHLFVFLQARGIQ